jgi:hypothetical protein
MYVPQTFDIKSGKFRFLLPNLIPSKDPNHPIINTKNATLWPESANELYRPSDRRLSAKLVPTFADEGCHMVSVTNPHERILGFLDRSRYFFLQVAPQLYSRG